MHLLAWLDSLSGVATSDSSAPAASRRLALTRLGRAALATLPTAALTLPAMAGPPRITSITTDTLNLVMTVAFAQRELLTQALGTGSTSVPAPDRATFETMRTLLSDLLDRLTLSVTGSGDAAAVAKAYDFTGGRSSAGTGPLRPFTSTDDFLGLAQELADLLSRTLISGVSALAGNTVFSELLAQFLATASRMAATIRLIRQRRGATNATPWISEEDAAGAPALLAGVYDGEASTTVFKLDLLQEIPATTTTPRIAVLPAPLPSRTVATEAFDQPLPLDLGGPGVPEETALPQKKVAALIELLTIA